MAGMYDIRRVRVHMVGLGLKASADPFGALERFRKELLAWAGEGSGTAGFRL